MRTLALLPIVVCLSGFAVDDTLVPGIHSIRFSYEWVDADEYFDTEGLRQSFADQGWSAYEGTRISMDYQYGLADGITLVLESQRLTRELASAEESFKTSDFGDVYVGLKQRLSPFASSHILISEIGFSTPEGYDQEDPLPLGGGGINWFAIMTYGQKFYPLRGSFQLDVAYVFRNEDPDDELRVHADVEFGLTRSLWLTMAFDTEESDSRSLTPFDVLTYPHEHGSQRGRLQLRYYVTDRWQVDVYATQMLGGRNQFDETNLGLAIGWQSQR